MANVAQLVEPRIVVPVVAGSIPVVRPKGLSEDSPFFVRYFVIRKRDFPKLPWQD